MFAGAVTTATIVAESITIAGVLVGVGIGLLVAVIVGGAGWLVRYLRRPVLVLEWGDGLLFDRNVAPTDYERSLIKGNQVDGSYAKCLIVREKRGRSAFGVQVRIVSITPCEPSEEMHLPEDLHWLDNYRKRLDIAGGSKGLAALQRIVFGNGHMAYGPAVFSPGDRPVQIGEDEVVVDLEVLSDNAKKLRQQLIVSEPWPSFYSAIPSAPQEINYPQVRQPS